MPTFTASDGKEFDNRNEYRKYEFQLSYTFTGKEDVHDLVKTPGSVDGQPFDMGNLKNCTAVVMDATDQVQIDEVENSKIFLGATGESVFVRNCKDCTFYIACKQLRTRECVNCTFYLYCISEPIIEMSTGIKFGCFNGGYPEQANHMSKAGLNPEVNKWSMVFDFNDEAKTGKNFAIMPLSEYSENSWFPHGTECERAVPLLEGEVAAAQAYKLVPENTTGGVGGMSFDFNTTQEQAETAVAAAEEAKPPNPPAVVASSSSLPPTPAVVVEEGVIKEGTKVEAKFGQGTTWYLAHVVKVLPGDKYNLDYLDGSKETNVPKEFVQLPVKRVVGWNPAAAKAKAEQRKLSGEEAPTALGSDPTAGLKLRALIDEEERLAALALNDKIELIYFNARGVIEPTRLMLSLANVSYKDTRLPNKETFNELKAKGNFAINLDKVPILKIGDKLSIGQSKAIDRYIANKFGFLGSTELEAAQIDMLCEHCNDIKKSYNDVKKKSSVEEGDELEKVKNDWLVNELSDWAKKLELSYSNPLEKLNYAEIRMFDLFYDFFDNKELSMAAIESCPKLKKSVQKVTENAKQWLEIRPKTMF